MSHKSLSTRLHEVLERTLSAALARPPSPLTAQPAAAPGVELIVDNANATVVGAWSTATGTKDKYGSNYLYTSPSLSGNKSVTFTPNIPATASDWQIYVWYPTVCGATPEAQVIVHHAAGDTTVSVNQAANQGRWSLLGTFTLNAGTGNSVKITDYGSQTKKKVLADALRFYSPTGGLAAPEIRAVWADTWNNGLLSAGQVTTLVNTAGAANYNVILPQVRKSGDAYYNSAYEPRASNIRDPLPFDPLADLITKAHAAGMEVYPWIVTYRIWDSVWGAPPSGHIWSLHPEWAMKDSAGNILDGVFYNLDPGVPGVQDYICKVAIDLVSKYDVDGLNWDYIRYPGLYWGYNDITRQRFFNEFSFWPPTATADPHWETWAQYRRQQVTDLVKKCYLEVLALKPKVRISVDTVGMMGGDPNAGYTQTRQYKEVFQNAKSWIEQHTVDTIFLMNYKRESDAAQAADYRLWSAFIAGNARASGRHTVDGQGAYLNAIAESLAQMSYARTAGCQGGSTYSYNATNKDGQPGSDFWNAARANLYTQPASIPAMPWKSSPSGGVIFGTVTAAAQPNDPIYQNWVYQATVTLSGPVISTSLTDATGTYGFLDVPPGVYTITIAKTGFPSQTLENVAVSAGQVLRQNVSL